MNTPPTKVAVLLLGILAFAAPLGLAEPAVKPAPAALPAKPPRALIFLWMQGGASHLDTFDLKPEAPLEIRGPFKSLPTSIPDLHISEHLPRLARLAEHLAVIRSVTHRETNHDDAEYLLHTGRQRRNLTNYPSLPAALARELGKEQSLLPHFVCLGGTPSVGAGYLEGQYIPILVSDAMLRRPARAGSAPAPVAALSDEQLAALLRQLSTGDLASRNRARAQLEDQGSRALPALRKAQASKPDLETHQRLDQLLERIKAEQFAAALNLEQEPLALRESYGRDQFGQGCLAARRLVERGVPVVEVILGGWDTHVDAFKALKQRSAVLDNAWATLLADLKERGLLDTTLVVWAGEFGRTPRINGQGGRDHWPQAFSVVLAGGGTKGGTVIGKTDRRGAEVAERPVSVPEFLATICAALGIDPARRQLVERGLTIPLVDDNTQPVQEALRVKTAK